ncbi:MAG: ribosome maturation factor RimP [Bacillota bacterium]|nr:ribosome maturation factor RimP [Bacillota bacterium]
MSKRENYEQQTEKLLLPIVQANHVEIYDVEYVKEGSDWYLRCYIDKEGGVSINDCEAVSRALSDELDKEDFIEDAYILEVSSPGLGRALKKDKHLQRSLNEEVDIRTYKPINGSKDFNGILKAFDEGTITILTASGDEAEDMVFDRKDIAAIKLALDF